MILSLGDYRRYDRSPPRTDRYNDRHGDRYNDRSNDRYQDRSYDRSYDRKHHDALRIEFEILGPYRRYERSPPRFDDRESRKYDRYDDYRGPPPRARSPY